MCICCRTTRLPSRCSGTTGYTHRDRWVGFMKYAVKTVSGAIIYIPSFIKNGLAIRKLMGRGFRETQTGLWSYKPTSLFFKWGKLANNQWKDSTHTFSHKIDLEYLPWKRSRLLHIGSLLIAEYRATTKSVWPVKLVSRKPTLTFGSLRGVWLFFWHHLSSLV
jgi:hypothetical protein